MPEVPEVPDPAGAQQERQDHLLDDRRVGPGEGRQNRRSLGIGDAPSAGTRSAEGYPHHPLSLRTAPASARTRQGGVHRGVGTECGDTQ